jgi:hypothetical protein
VKRFRYQKLKKVREIQKRLAESDVWLSYKRMMDLAVASRQEVLEVSKLKNTVNSPMFWELFSDWEDSRKNQLRMAYKMWKSSLERLLEKRTELKKVEKLEEMWKRQVLSEMLNQLSKQMDDVGTSRYKINKKERR